jgi:hypothetical protein
MIGKMAWGPVAGLAPVRSRCAARPVVTCHVRPAHNDGVGHPWQKKAGMVAGPMPFTGSAYAVTRAIAAAS